MPISKNLVFKGGTSLSKAFNIIDRFSEDVDKEKYQSELSALAYRPIPNEKDVEECFENLIKRIK